MCTHLLISRNTPFCLIAILFLTYIYIYVIWLLICSFVFWSTISAWMETVDLGDGLLGWSSDLPDTLVVHFENHPQMVCLSSCLPFKHASSVLWIVLTKYGYGSIPIDTFLVGWTSIYHHLPAIFGFTRYQGFDPSPYEGSWPTLIALALFFNLRAEDWWMFGQRWGILNKTGDVWLTKVLEVSPRLYPLVI